jgi:hypothetical protein
MDEEGEVDEDAISCSLHLKVAKEYVRSECLDSLVHDVVSGFCPKKTGANASDEKKRNTSIRKRVSPLTSTVGAGPLDLVFSGRTMQPASST